MAEGRIAALRVAALLGKMDENHLAAELRTLSGLRRRLRRFGATVNTLFAPTPALDCLATDDTPICRCEEVLASELRAAIASGVRSLDELKIRTRAGQGPCQGRTCGPLAARLVSRQTGLTLADVEGFRVRPPIKPIPLAALSQADRE
jgi:NAD(P)H-nitrite reductase large subunit